MKRSHYMMLTLLISGVLFSSGFALSSDGTQKTEKTLKATLSMEDAITAAKAKFPGQVLESELENKEGMAVYEVEIASATGVVSEIKVDAQSGEILSSAIEDEDEAKQGPSEEDDKD